MNPQEVNIRLHPDGAATISKVDYIDLNPKKTIEEEYAVVKDRSAIQAFVFDREIFKSTAEAETWALQNGHGKVVVCDPVSVEKQGDPYAICTATLGETGTERWRRCVEHLGGTCGKSRSTKSEDAPFVMPWLSKLRDRSDFVEGSLSARLIAKGVNAILGLPLPAKKSEAEIEWEEKSADLLPAVGVDLPFVIHGRDGVQKIRLGTDKFNGWIGFSVARGAPDGTLDGPASVGETGPTWWIEESVDGYEVLDKGTWRLESSDPSSMIFRLDGSSHKGVYSLARSSGGWRARGPRSTTYSVVKQASEQRYTLGVAYPANKIDAHGDTMTAIEVEAAAWGFMQKIRSGAAGAGVMHQEGTDGAGEVVESYIYRGPDWTVDGQTVHSGDWLLGVVWDEKVWSDIKNGVFKGYSIQGWALKT